MLKEIVIAVEAYFRAHRFISKHRLWKWILIPGILYMILFVVGMYVFWHSSDAAVSYITSRLRIDKWVHRQQSDILSFLFVMGEMMVRLILIFFYFSLFKYLFLILGSPLFAYLSEKTESIMEGRDFPFSFSQFIERCLQGHKAGIKKYFMANRVYRFYIDPFIFSRSWLDYAPDNAFR